MSKAPLASPLAASGRSPVMFDLLGGRQCRGTAARAELQRQAAAKITHNTATMHGPVERLPASRLKINPPMIPAMPTSQE